MIRICAVIIMDIIRLCAVHTYAISLMHNMNLQQSISSSTIYFHRTHKHPPWNVYKISRGCRLNATYRYRIMKKIWFSLTFDIWGCVNAEICVCVFVIAVVVVVDVVVAVGLWPSIDSGYDMSRDIAWSSKPFWMKSSWPLKLLNGINNKWKRSGKGRVSPTEMLVLCRMIRIDLYSGLEVCCNFSLLN